MYFSAAGNFGSRSYSDTLTPGPFPNINRHDFGIGNVLQSVELGTGEFIIVLQRKNDFFSLGAPNGVSTIVRHANSDGAIAIGAVRYTNTTSLG